MTLRQSFRRHRPGPPHDKDAARSAPALFTRSVFSASRVQAGGERVPGIETLPHGRISAPWRTLREYSRRQRHPVRIRENLFRVNGRLTFGCQKRKAGGNGPTGSSKGGNEMYDHLILLLLMMMLLDVKIKIIIRKR